MSHYDDLPDSELRRIGRETAARRDTAVPLDPEIIFALRRAGDKKTLDALADMRRFGGLRLMPSGADSDVAYGILAQYGEAESTFEYMYGP